ncbi:Protein of unknown function [Lactobacillus gigeriorum DSM 23908 = CRBIP 24.85]|uniref:Uncharacterized protein n=1 Tax=Lactobacillus gigeriorum DSM 23908 = CRBIP 24.85 TaxID=1423751 RepID=I7J2V5_9LACO|nr:Protein of unknown function [Lactobacillus gigeriorum DSM 23908 = CRBIP 24.85]
MQEYHWTPKQWADLSIREKSIVIASIQIRTRDEKRQQKEAERKARRKHI